MHAGMPMLVDSDDEDDTHITKAASKSGLPKQSMLNGLYQGAIPSKLQEMTIVEQSMISLFHPITTTAMMAGKYYIAKGATTYTIVNDLTSVAQQLPQCPDITTFAILRPQGGKSHKTLTYRPKKVKEALMWLKANNHLYQDVNIVFWEDLPQNAHWDSNETLDIPHVELEDNDVAGIDLELSADETIMQTHLSTNTGAPSHVTEVLCISDSKFTTTAQDLREFTVDPSKPTLTSMQRNKVQQFVNPWSQPDFFLAKCFPTLFPYGRGDPTDPLSKITSYAEHSNLMLRRGGGPQGRRFQQHYNYYFTMCTLETKRKIGAIAYKAYNPFYDVLNLDQLPVQDSLKVKDLNNALAELHSGTTTSSGNLL
jgi:hypothetical protein